MKPPKTEIAVDKDKEKDKEQPRTVAKAPAPAKKVPAAGAKPSNKAFHARLGLTIGSFFCPLPFQDMTPTFPPPR